MLFLSGCKFIIILSQNKALFATIKSLCLGLSFFISMSKRLNILTITSWYPNKEDPQLGVFIKDQLNATQHLHDITLIIVKPNSHEDVKINKNDNLKIIELSYVVPISILKPLYWLLAWRKGFHLVKNEKFNLLHLHVIYPIGIVALWFKKCANLPLVVSEHWTGYASKKEYKGFFRKLITNRIVKKSMALTVPSHFLRLQMEKLGLISNYFVLPNIVKFAEIESIPSKDSNFIYVLNVADHVDSDKNISGFLKACKICMEQNSRLRFVQIGGGTDSKELIKLGHKLGLDTVLKWAGRLKNEDVLKQMSLCDFGVINSNVETFSVAAFEFLAAQKPIIITECGIPSELLPDGFGVKTAVNDSSLLAKAILKMAGEFSTYPSSEVSKTIKTDFSPQKFSVNLDRVYQNILT